MAKGTLWRVSVRTSAEAEEAVTALFGDLFPEPASVYSDAETGRSLVSVFCQKLPKTVTRLRAELRSRLCHVRACGLDTRPGGTTVKRIRYEDWAESWKKHFRPLEVGNELLIKPGWSRRKARKGQALVVLDPGLSFGTGQHPTTSFCLKQLVACRDCRPQTRSLLDLGTGSGILAIAAAKLGYQPVHALDFDAACVRVAEANAIQNGVQSLVRVSQRDLTRMPRVSRTRYDVICANLTYDLLLKTLRTILARLKPGGKLVLAGILNAQFGTVKEACSAAGLEAIDCVVEKEWQSAVFRRRR